MKAVLCKSYGPPDSLVVEDVPPPTARHGEAVISVKAAGVNFPDVLIILNKYQVKPPLPFSPGSEAAGVVKAIGDGVDHVKIGDRVMAITGYGAFAEEIAVDAARLLPIPDGMDFTTAAAFGLTYATSDHALRDRGELKAGETLLVLGAAGGVGFAAGEIPRIPLNLTLLKGCSIVGVYWGEFSRREPQRFAESMRQLARWFANGRLKPHISSTFPLERASDALELMAERKVEGKVVLTVDRRD